MTKQMAQAMLFSCENVRQKILLSLLFSTGMTIQDLCLIRIKDIDFAKNEIHCGSRIYYIQFVLQSMVRDYIHSECSDYLFTNRNNNQLKPRSVAHEISSIAHRIGFKVSTRDIRIYFFKEMLKYGIKKSIITQVSGGIPTKTLNVKTSHEIFDVANPINTII